jgi:ATP/maltotriose-dependent transcriptional regulator MalT
MRITGPPGPRPKLSGLPTAKPRTLGAHSRSGRPARGLLPGNRQGSRDAAGPPVPALTPKELSVLELLASGGGYVEIAKGLEIELNTVRTHIRSLYEKLGVENWAGAVNLGWSLGLLRRPA